MLGISQRQLPQRRFLCLCAYGKPSLFETRLGGSHDRSDGRSSGLASRLGQYAKGSVHADITCSPSEARGLRRLGTDGAGRSVRDEQT